MTRHNAFNLQVQIGDSGSSIFQLAGDFQDDYADFDAAELQACTLSLLPRLPVRVWGGKVQWLDLQKENAGVVIVHVGRWAVVGKCLNGLPVGFVPHAEVIKGMSTEQLIAYANALDGVLAVGADHAVEPEAVDAVQTITKTVANVRAEIANRPKNENWLYPEEPNYRPRA